jgi:glucokinase
MKKYIIGIDVGGTFVKTGIVRLDGTITGKILTIPTYPKDGPDATIERVCNAIEEVIIEKEIERSEIMGVGVGLPGLLDLKNGVILILPNLRGWDGYALKDKIFKRLNLPTYLDNDANAAALGEHLFGEGRGYKNVICLTLGTGIGGGVIVDGNILHGVNGAAGELGHITIVSENGRKCGCGNEGCIEAYAGTTGIIQRTLAEIKQHPDSELNKLGDIEKELTPKIIYDAAFSGDYFAGYILKETGRYLGIAISNFINIFNPEIIVLSGGISRAKEFLLPSIKKEVEARAFELPAKSAQITTSQLGEATGVIGAAGVFLSANKLLPKMHQDEIPVISEKRFVLGIHIGATGTRTALVSIEDDKVKILKATPLLPQGKNGKEIIDIVCSQTNQILANEEIDKQKILGTGMSTPAPLNVESKYIFRPPNLSWANVDIKEVFGKYLPQPIFIDNDADANALAELRFGKGKGVKNFLCITLCTGIGAGIIINGDIYRGSAGLAGEVGHQTIDYDGTRCECGNRGCLESLASGNAIVRIMKQRIDQGITTSLITKKDSLTYLDICDAADEGDEVSKELLADIGKWLGIGIANALNILNPDKLIISGKLSRAHKYFKSRLIKEARERAFERTLNIVNPFDITEFGNNVDLIAAASTFIHQWDCSQKK